MSGTVTSDFDVIFEISRARFVNVLRDLFVDDLPLLLGNVPISVPLAGNLAASVQTGFVSLPSRPTPSVVFAQGSPDSFTLTLDFAQSTLSLDEILPIGIPPVGGLGGLAPSQAGSTTLTLSLSISTATSDGESPVVIDLSGPTSLAELADITSLPIDAPLADVRGAIETAIVGAVEALFPLSIPVSLPGGAPSICDLGPRDLQMKLLPGPDGNAELDALGFFLTLLPDDQGAVPGDPDAITNSHLSEGGDGGGADGTLIISNRLLLELVCCLLPQVELQNLEGIEPERTDECCRWTNLTDFSLGGTTFDEVAAIEVCILDDGLEIRGEGLVVKGFGWKATYTFTLPVTLTHEGGVIAPVVGDLEIDVVEELEWWVWLVAGLVVAIFVVIGAILGVIAGAIGGNPVLGGVLGGIAGLVVGLAIAAIVIALIAAPLAVISEVVGVALESIDQLGSLNILPDDLKGVFGTLDLVGDPVIDDLQVWGHVVLPTRKPPRAEAAEIVLDVGDMLDLDRGIVIPAQGRPNIDLDADLAWVGELKGEPFPLPLPFPRWSFGRGTRGVAIRRRGFARLVQLSGASFWALTESDLADVRYSQWSVPVGSDALPLSDGGRPRDAAVLAVRTTEGRYAKCAAWRDSRGRLHLHFKTYDTPVPLTLRSTWVSSRGKRVGGGWDFPVSYDEYQVSWHGTFRAETQGLLWPLRYRWTIGGQEISGEGRLPNRGGEYRVKGAVCELWTTMGADFSDEICVEVMDATGGGAATCREVDLRGTERVYSEAEIRVIRGWDLYFGELEGRVDVPRGPGPGPGFGPGPEPVVDRRALEAKLTEALARGMEINVQDLVRR